LNGKGRIANAKVDGHALQKRAKVVIIWLARAGRSRYLGTFCKSSIAWSILLLLFIELTLPKRLL